MKKILYIYYKILVFLIFFNNTIFCHPVSYKDAIAVMSWNQPFLSDSWVVYSVTSQCGAAFRYMRARFNSGDTMYYVAPQIDFLLQRWNEQNWQTNIYAYGAAGDMSYQNTQNFAGLGGIEADAESRKYFFLLKAEYMSSFKNFTYYQLLGRVGLSPYEAEFEELASWFMIQAQYNPMLVNNFLLTPLFRMFYKSFLLEAGVSLDGEGMLNFMFHF